MKLLGPFKPFNVVPCMDRVSTHVAFASEVFANDDPDSHTCLRIPLDFGEGFALVELASPFLNRQVKIASRGVCSMGSER